MKISDVRFDSEFEEEGIWWLPENQDNKISGKLSYSISSGIRLKIVHSKPFFEQQESRLDVIHGILKSGLQISLFRCLEIHNLFRYFSSNSSLKITKIFYIHDAFFGKHFEEKDLSQIRFQKGKNRL